MLSCSPNRPKTVIFAASSTGPAIAAIKVELKKQGLVVIDNIGPSSLLAQQIRNGANCDVVLLADQAWMDVLEKNSLIIPNSRMDLLSNRLTVVTSKNNSSVTWPPQNGERIAVGDFSHLPLGRYTKQALAQFHITDKQLVMGPDARTVLAWVEKGETPLGIVYQSDAVTSKHVQILAHLPENTHSPIRYPMAQCKNSKNRTVYDFLKSETAKRTFAQHGF